MSKTKYTPGKKLLRTVRAGFISHGTSLSAWCQMNGITREWATQCLLGTGSGGAADAIVRRLVDASSGHDTQ